MAERNRAGRLIIRGGTSSGLGFAIRFGARFLFLFVAGRLFGATLFGAYSIAVALVESAVIAGGLSTKWMLFKWLNDPAPGDEGRPPIHIVLDAVLLVTGVSVLIAVLIALGVLVAPASLLGRNTQVAILVLAPMIPLQALIELLLGATRWRETMRYEVVAKNVMQPYAAIVVALVAWAIGGRGEGLILSYVAGTVASLLYSIYGLRRCFGALMLGRYRPRAEALRAKLRASLPPAGAELIDALYTRLDIYVVGLLLGEHAAGIYGMARQLSMPIRQVRQAFDGMLVPVVARTVAQAGPTETGRAIASAARLIFLVQLIAIIVLIAIGMPILHLVGKDFYRGYGVVLLLAAGEVIQGAFGLSELVLIYVHPRIAVLMTAAFMVLGVVGAVLLEPLLGLAGVALAVLLSYSLRALVRRLVIRRFYSVDVPVSYWLGPAVAAVTALAAAGLLGGHPLFNHGMMGALPGLFTGLVFYAAILFLWVRTTGAELVPQGFVAGEADEAAA